MTVLEGRKFPSLNKLPSAFHRSADFLGLLNLRTVPLFRIRIDLCCGSFSIHFLFSADELSPIENQE